MMNVDMQADIDMKPECVVSSGCGNPVKSEEETDDEDNMYKAATDRASSHENHLPINIKQEVVKVEVKGEEDDSTDDERSPECVISSSGYDPVKSEETYNEEPGEDTNTSNEQHLPIKVKAEVKTEDESTDDENGNETKETVELSSQSNVSSQESMDIQHTRNKRHPAQSNVSSQESMDIKHTRRKKRSRSKRKEEVEGEESNGGSVKKVARIECSVEGCKLKAADSGTCKTKHGGYNHCKQEGCTKAAQKGGVCIRHGAVQKTCSRDSCTNIAVKGGVCVRHGAKVKTCKYEGCTNGVIKGGVCVRSQDMQL